MEKFEIYDLPKELYKRMLLDIKRARKEIFLETYIYDNDEIGLKFKEALIEKAKKGVKIKVLVDSWGSTANKQFFSDLIKTGAEVRFFKEFQYVIRIFSENHKRNHRKLLVIDEKITYMGSANISKSCLEWWEATARIKGEISKILRTDFLKSWENREPLQILHLKSLRPIRYKGFKIITDLASFIERPTQNAYIHLIKNAKREILIETPYFIPPFLVRRALRNAVRKGVRVVVITPDISDVRIVDILKQKFMGALHKAGIKLFLYKPRILHSKVMIVDDDKFIFGSSNLDYRSFAYQYELNLAGKSKKLNKILKVHFEKTLKDSQPFAYQKWKKRSDFQKLAENVLYWFRHFF